MVSDQSIPPGQPPPPASYQGLYLGPSRFRKPLLAFPAARVRTGLYRETHPLLALLPRSSFYLQKQGGAGGDQAKSESKEALRVGWGVPEAILCLSPSYS